MVHDAYGATSHQSHLSLITYLWAKTLCQNLLTTSWTGAAMMGEFEVRGCACRSIVAPLEYSPVEVIVLPRSDDIAEEPNGRLYNERPELVLLLDSYDATMCVQPCLHTHTHAHVHTHAHTHTQKHAQTCLHLRPAYMH